MMSRIVSNQSPHFAFLQYNPELFSVTGLLFIPSHFITPNVIEKCKPLSPNARRAGWVGCNIHSNIPTDGHVYAVAGGSLISPEKVRKQWAQFQWMSGQRANLRGWTADILRIVRGFGSAAFTLQDMYAAERDLQKLYPNNKNIRAKIRQQLQVLRDHAIIRFLGNGRYIAI